MLRSRVSPIRLWALFALLFLLIGLQGGVALFVLDDFTQSVAELRMIQGAGARIDEFGFLLNNFLNEMSVSIGIAPEGVGSVRPPPTAALAASAEALRRQLRSEPVVRLLTGVSELDAAVAAYDGHGAVRAQDEAALVYIRTIEPLADRLLSLDFPLSRQTILAEVARVGEASRQSGILANRVLVTSLAATLAVGLFLGRLLWVSLHEATVQALELERRASELAIAHGIQTSVLPHDLDLPGFELAAVMLTANEVGGDFYEFRRTVDGGAWIAVGDVTGHGLRAGIVMLMVQSMFATLSADNEPDAASPKRLIERLNRAVFLNLRDRLREVRYVTMSWRACSRMGAWSLPGHTHGPPRLPSRRRLCRAHPDRRALARPCRGCLPCDRRQGSPPGTGRRRGVPHRWRDRGPRRAGPVLRSRSAGPPAAAAEPGEGRHPRRGDGRCRTRLGTRSVR
jgi:hypothetical protein